MDDYNLKELQEQVERYRVLERRKAGLAQQKTELFAEECRLAALRAKEDADVEKWEGGSLATFFYGVFGKREDRLEKEKAEAYEAAVKHDAVKAELAAVERELQEVDREMQTLKGCEWNFKKAIDAKAAALAAEGKDNGILELQQEQAKAKAYQLELQEAVMAGNQVLREVANVQQLLGEARSWGIWDMAGGGLISTMMKHEKLSDAQHSIERMYTQLHRFQREMADVSFWMDIQVRVDGFWQAADYIFDGLLVDWSVQSQIAEAREKVDRLEAEVRKAYDRLKQMQKEAEEDAVRLEEEWQKKIAAL